MTSPAPLDRITAQDWALAVIGVTFTLASLLILTHDVKTGLLTLPFFSVCAVHAVGVIVRKRRTQRQVAVKATVVGGVPIRPSRLRMALLAGAVLAIGATQLAFGPRHHGLMMGIGGLLTVLGIALLGAVALGRLPSGHVQFDPAGITFAQRDGTAQVPWDAITRLARSEMSDNPMVLIDVDADAVVISPPGECGRWFQRMGRSRGRLGADFVIMTGAYGIDAPVLLAALQRYAAEPGARQELARVPRLPG